MSNLIDELRQLSLSAESAETKWGKSLNRAQEVLEQAKVEKAMGSLPDLARAAASAGKRQCVVFTHGPENMGYTLDRGGESWPTGAAKIIAEKCKAQGFIVEWGMREHGWGITIKW